MNLSPRLIIAFGILDASVNIALFPVLCLPCKLGYGRCSQGSTSWRPDLAVRIGIHSKFAHVSFRALSTAK